MCFRATQAMATARRLSQDRKPSKAPADPEMTATMGDLYQLEERLRHEFDERLYSLERRFNAVRPSQRHLLKSSSREPTKDELEPRPPDAPAVAANDETTDTLDADADAVAGEEDAEAAPEEAITYENAYESLGGDDAVAEFAELSAELVASTKNAELEAQLVDLLPDRLGRNAYTTRIVYQHFVTNLQELYAQARGVIDSFHDLVRELATSTEGTASCPPIKGSKRAEAKANFKYRDAKGHGVAWFRLTDLVRATIGYSDLKAMYTGLREVMSACGENVKEVNDRYQEPLGGEGYRDLQLVISHKGHMCELQLNTLVMLKAKETTGHRTFEVVRELRAAVSDNAIGRVSHALAWGRECFGTGHGSDSGASLKEILNVEGIGLMHIAAAKGFATVTYRLICEGMNVNAQDGDGNTPLHLAIKGGYIRCAWALIDNGADISIVNNDGHSALMIGHLLLWTRPPEQSVRAVMMLSTLAGAEAVAEVKARLRDERHKMFRNSIDLYHMCADALGDVDRIRKQLNDFANPDTLDPMSEQPALVAACFNNNVGAVRLLLEYHADPQIRFDSRASVDVRARTEGDTPLEAALKGGSTEIVEMLFAAGVPQPESGDLLFRMIETRFSGENKWCGIVAYEDRVFAAPRNDTAVLIFDTRTEKVKRVETGLRTIGGWESICECNGRLFCPPFMADYVLVIDPTDDSVKTLELPNEILADATASTSSQEARRHVSRWSSAAACNGKVYCSPAWGNKILVIDAETEEISIIDTGEGALEVVANADVRKWDGICHFDGKLYCAPSSHQSVLVIDTADDSFSFIETRDPSEAKFAGICALNGKLYCCPCNSEYALVIDPATGELEHIETGIRRSAKWSGIVSWDGSLFCAPLSESSVLEINPETKLSKTHDTGDASTQRDRWDGICECDGRLYCAPSDMSSILTVSTMAQAIAHLGL